MGAIRTGLWEVLRVHRLIGGAARALEWVSVASVIFIGSATLIDVTGRYFNRPLYGAYEMIQIAMIFLIFTALPSATLKREHITIDLVLGSMPDSVRRILVVLASAVGLGACLFYAVQLWARGTYLERTGEVTSNLLLPLSPFVFLVAVLWCFTAVCFGVLIYDDARKIYARRGEA
jgi:TRAP-type C4-dicarboxylate transport system permease small subunit